VQVQAHALEVEERQRAGGEQVRQAEAVAGVSTSGCRGLPRVRTRQA
jgi:hypothetical protein